MSWFNYQVTLNKIKWDKEGSKVKLPSKLILNVEASDEENALDYALNEASNQTGFSILDSKPNIKKVNPKMSAVRMNNKMLEGIFSNPSFDSIKSNPKYHFPKTKKGRKRKVGRPASKEHTKVFRKGKKASPSLFALRFFDSSGKLMDTIKGRGYRKDAIIEAQTFVGKFRGSKRIDKVELIG